MDHEHRPRARGAAPAARAGSISAARKRRDLAAATGAAAAGGALHRRGRSGGASLCRHARAQTKPARVWWAQQQGAQRKPAPISAVCARTGARQRAAKDKNSSCGPRLSTPKISEHMSATRRSTSSTQSAAWAGFSEARTLGSAAAPEAARVTARSTGDMTSARAPLANRRAMTASASSARMPAASIRSAMLASARNGAANAAA